MEDDSRLSFFLIGLGLGVVGGILFAPKSGAETRDYLRDRANEGADYVKRRGDEFRETAEETIIRGKETLRRQKESLASAVEAGKHAYREASADPLAD